MFATVHPYLLAGFLEYYVSRPAPLATYAQWTWIGRGPGLNAQKVSDRKGVFGFRNKPIRFTVFGVVSSVNRDGTVDLARPQWDLFGSAGRGLGIQFDMQILTLCKVLEEHDHGNSFDFRDVIHIKTDVDSMALDTAVFATCLLTVFEYGAGAPMPYILEVADLEAVYSTVLGMPVYWLAQFPPLSDAGVYKTDFAATRVSSTTDRRGSIYMCRPINQSPGVARDPGLKPLIRPQMFTIVGCVLQLRRCGDNVDLWDATVGLPPNPNTLAVQLCEAQEKLLKDIAQVDRRNRVEWEPTWGSPFASYTTPTVVVQLERDSREPTDRVEIGQDIVVKAILFRVDINAGCRYYMTAGRQGALRPSELRAPDVAPN
ncbi:hypothetical protein C8R47DRAFT_1228426 [Mycena vitilis]|nr:hypothetical protein C8R47DRAFT_1228426 [Mycena vitilis]